MTKYSYCLYLFPVLLMMTAAQTAPLDSIERNTDNKSYYDQLFMFCLLAFLRVLMTARKQRLEPRKPPVQKRSRATVNDILSAGAQVLRLTVTRPGRPTASPNERVCPSEPFISIFRARRRLPWRCSAAHRRHRPPPP